MWWHHVEGLADFNILVNYWWRRTPAWLGQPQAALNHTILAIRDLPAEDKAIWREQFDHYVFENDDGVTDHIPEKARSILARLTPASAGRLRAFLLRTLSRCMRIKRSSASSSRAAARRAGWRRRLSRARWGRLSTCPQLSQKRAGRT